MAYETTDYQVSADQSAATVLRVWSHHWGCQVDCLTSNGMHSYSWIENKVEQQVERSKVTEVVLLKSMQPLAAFEGQNFASDMTCLLLV